MPVDSIWELQDAQRKFDEMIDQALTQGAQIIIRQGKETVKETVKEMVVVISFEEYQRLTNHGSLAQFLLESPLAGSDLPIKRDKWPIR